MKLSNKILIGFFGFVLVYMIAAFTEIRLKGDVNRFDETNSKLETIAMTGIRHLVVQDVGTEINIGVSDQHGVELRSKNGQMLPKLKYRMQGDTLSILSLDLTDREVLQIYIYVADELEEIEVKGATVIINDLDQPGLSISQTGGRVRMLENNKLDKVSIIATEGADLEGTGFELKTLSVEANHADVRFYSPVHRVEGSMSNASSLYVRSPSEIAFKKDESSRWQVQN